MSIEEVLQGLMEETKSLSYVDHLVTNLIVSALGVPRGILRQESSAMLADDCYRMAQRFIERARRGPGGY